MILFPFDYQITLNSEEFGNTPFYGFCASTFGLHTPLVAAPEAQKRFYTFCASSSSAEAQKNFLRLSRRLWSRSKAKSRSAEAQKGHFLLLSLFINQLTTKRPM